MEIIMEFQKEKVIHSLYEHISIAADDFGDNTLFEFARHGEDYSITYRNFLEYVSAITRGLIHFGLDKKRIVIVGETSVEWIATYLATVTSGGVIVPIDVMLNKEQFASFVKEADGEIVVYSDSWAEYIEGHADEMNSIKHFFRLTDEVFDPHADGICKKQKYMRISDLSKAGNSKTDIAIPEQVTDVMSTLLFTSGTTGSSKGVMISQGNICAVLNDIYPVLYHITEEDVLLSVLPVHHTYEMSAGILAPMLYGAKICINDSIKHVLKNLQKYRPTVMTLVPLFVEQFYNNIKKSIKKQGIEKTFNLALKMSRAAGKIGLDVRNVLFSKVKAAFGGRLKYIVCGGAALRPELVEIFETLGVRISQGYGITECAPLISVVPLNIYNPKSCGKLSGGMQIFIDKEKPDDDFGEIVVKGKNVMLGYYKNEEATKEVLSKGWFYTGDYGYIDEDNYLYITGRKKNVIVLQDGKNVFPEELEEYLSAIPLVNECVVVGREKDKDICITALVYPDAEYAESIGLTKKEDIHLEIRNQINLINKNLVGYKRIAAVEFRQEPFEKTPTKKIKRFLVK